MVPPRPDRRSSMAQACLHLLATLGSRGLTHRAVDQALELPLGSTSYYFRTRRALWEAASDALVEADRRDVERHLSAGGVDLEGLLSAWTAPEARTSLVARFELYLAGARDPEFRAHLRHHRQSFLDAVERSMRLQQRPDPTRAALDTVAAFEGALLQRAVFDPLPPPAQ